MGLTKKEVDKVFFYVNFKDKHFAGILLTLILIFIGFIILLSSLSVPPYIPKNNTYQTGALYSTVKIKDFRAKK